MTQEEIGAIMKQDKLWHDTSGKQGKPADFSNCDLRHSSFSDCVLNNVDFTNCNLQSADFEFADIWSCDFTNADLKNADFRNTNLGNAELCYADMKDANIDFSSFPLCCGGLNVHIDDRQAIQILYHLVRNVLFSKNTSKRVKRILGLKSIVRLANEFHRVDECGKIEVEKERENN